VPLLPRANAHRSRYLLMQNSNFLQADQLARRLEKP
jgi:hypothetical protein